MKKIYMYAGIGGWLMLMLLLVVGITSPNSSELESAGSVAEFYMHEVVTHKISDDRHIAVQVTDAYIVLDSKTPKVCFLGECVNDRDPGKYMLTVVMSVTNLGNDEYRDSPYKFEIRDGNDEQYAPAARHVKFSLQDIAKGETYQTKILYDVNPPISQYTLVLKQDWSDKTTLITLNNLQNLRSDLCRGNADCFGGFVEEVIDGDTINVLDIESEQSRKIGLLVDTPDKGEANYRNAQDFVAGFCPIGSYVLFDEDDGQIEESEKQVGRLFCEGEPISERLLEHELAVIESKFCEVSEYAREPWVKKFGCD